MRWVCLLALAVVGLSLPIKDIRADVDKLIDTAISEGPVVWNRVAYITDTYGPRFSGSQALEDSISDIKQQMLADGLDVVEEPVMIPKWVRGEEFARLLSPRVKKLHFVGLGMSNGTNGRPVQAPVLVVKSFDELKARAAEAKGKIVVFNVAWQSYSYNVAYRSSGALMAAAVGAVGVLVRSVTPFSMQTPHTGNSQTASIPAGAISVEDALQLQRMQDRGQKVVVEIYMEARFEPDVLSRNLVATLRGAEKPDEFVIIGGHIDSWDTAEGAMDDGAGAFVSWEALRLMSNLRLRPRRSVRAVLFVNEENGNRGGQAYAKAHAAELNRTSLAIESDMGNFLPFRLGFKGSPAAFAILEQIGRTYLARIGAGNVTDGEGGVDIGPMCNQGVPCGSLVVLDPRVGSNANNPCLGFSEGWPTYSGEISEGYFWYHHTEADTVDKLDPEQLQLNVAAMSAWAYAVASLDDLLPR